MAESLSSIRLSNEDGFEVEILNLGAAIRSLRVPMGGSSIETVLNYPTLDSYKNDPYYLGSTIGPYANRLADGLFTLGGNRYQLDVNEEAHNNCLHGGFNGLNQALFQLERIDDDSAIRCWVHRDDGLDGFPGARSFEVIYSLLSPATLVIDYRVTTDQDTVIGLTNHAYFNLGGSINDHSLQVFADRYTPTDRSLRPTGEIKPVSGTELDLRPTQKVGNRIFDHNFVLNESESTLKLAAKLASRETGISLSVYTSQPGLQLYTGDGLGAPFAPRSGLCLEAQQFPNAPNQANFPSVRLNRGEIHTSRIEYRFDVPH